jgi:membrane dipeptidase
MKQFWPRTCVIGVALDLWMLKPGFIADETPNTTASLDTVADHIDHICGLAGNGRHAGMGSGLDGEFGTEQTPSELAVRSGEWKRVVQDALDESKRAA